MKHRQTLALNDATGHLRRLPTIFISFTNRPTCIFSSFFCLLAQNNRIHLFSVTAAALAWFLSDRRLPFSENILLVEMRNRSWFCMPWSGCFPFFFFLVLSFVYIYLYFYKGLSSFCFFFLFFFMHHIFLFDFYSICSFCRVLINELDFHSPDSWLPFQEESYLFIFLGTNLEIFYMFWFTSWSKTI